MEMCSLSVTRTPLTASVIAAASATPSAWRTKVMLPSTPVLCNCTCHCLNTFVGVCVCVGCVASGRCFVFLFFLSACAVSPVLSEATTQASVDLRCLGVLPGGESSEDAAQEDFQYKLKGFIDSTVDKR